MTVLWALLAVLALLLWPVVLRALRREKPAPVVAWIPDNRSDQERFESYADEKLREMGLAGRLKAETDELISQRRPDDYVAEIEAIDEFAREKGWP